ncbi:MAG: hypothetical protein M1409_10160, partial [Actinobacteria bacterium]|nr:hypothetical protein [Actinomycetota bacterium]
MQEKILNRVISYWYECIRQEDILGKDISISVRSKAVLYPFNQDSFIFRKNELKIEINDEKILEFHNYARTKGFESYYGYPVLFYFDEESAKYLLAPLFIIKISFLPDGGKLYLQKDEPIPVCGIQALNKLGLKTEEIADINQLIETTFRNSVSISKENLVKKCIDIISKETYIQINEEINPGFLSNAKKLSKNSLPGLYNKSLIFIGDNTIYNMSLLEDLLELRLKNDLENTSLSFLLSNYTPTEGRDLIPILPFPANEYQIAALKDIFLNRLSVITGPPGTGKSQFISNLLINLFLEGKSVLFVSHTNPAVEVVNNKINSNFNNLMLRTGRKELR